MNNTLAARLKEVMKWHNAILHNHTSNCITGHEGELWMPTEVAEKAMEEALAAQLDAIIEEMEQDMDRTVFDTKTGFYRKGFGNGRYGALYEYARSLKEARSELLQQQ